MKKDKLSIISISLSQYVLGQLPGEKIPEIAITLLENGKENDEIIELAGMQNPTMADVENRFLKGLDKLKIHLPNIREATVCLAKQIAQKIADEEITPYEGARKIWWELANIENADRRLKAFVGLASEYEDTSNSEYRKVCEKQILEEACILLEGCK